MNLELKSFTNNNLLQNYRANFRPDSPLTNQALKILGIDKSDILTEEIETSGKKTNNFMNLLRSEQRNLKLLKTLREIFKKRKELKGENSNSNNTLKYRRKS